MMWLNLSKDGRLVPVAARRVAGSNEVALYVSNEPTRFVRFSRAGASPVTVPSSWLTRAEQWAIPAAEPGGELLAFIQAAQVMPTHYRIEGPASRTLVQRRTSFLSLRGLPPGGYSIQPVYAGGLPGKKVTAAVVNEGSSLATMKPENVGTAAASLAPSICADVRSVAVERVTAQSRREPRGTTPRAVAVTTPTRSCSATISGLEPGAYRALGLGEHGSVGEQEFEVMPQGVSAVEIGEYAARVSGSVTVNNRPAAHSFVRFQRMGNPIPLTHDARTDEDGRYAIHLNRPGRYLLALLDVLGMPVPGQRTGLEVVIGENSFDWPVVGGTLRIRLSGWDGHTPTRVLVRRLVDGNVGALAERTDNDQPVVVRSGALSRLLTASDPNPVTLSGVGFGFWHVQASQVNGRCSSGKKVFLGEHDPDKEVNLTLVENTARVAVVDEAGQPIREARPSAPIQELSPGTYSLRGLAPGSTLMVRAPGFASACRVVPAEGSVEVVLESGFPIELLFAGEALSRPPGLVVGLANSDCPVPLSALEYQPVGTLSEAGARFRFPHFPTSGVPRFAWRQGGESQLLEIPPNGPIVLLAPHIR